MSPSVERLPKYLLKYVAEQHWENYTAREHASWRYIMRQNIAFFRSHAVPIYIEGLATTGISLETIPRIVDMDACLRRFGWGAVPVVGFIPPAAFLDFQARGILPIACDMRTMEHIGYTPAPDIVHEAAGHAPIIADPAYAHYLHRYAQMAQKSITSIDDIRLYEAIRTLSDIKENPDTSEAAIAAAEASLKEVSASIRLSSELAMVTRMSWWTVEYGLVGDTKNPLIYGAGLLSSVAESQACLSDRVKKIPLTVDCVHTSYDITEPQPQLFVSPTLEHLVRVLEEFESTLSFRKGGTVGLERAQRAETVNTVQLDSGLQISGQLETFECQSEMPRWLKFRGPVQLAWGGTELVGHDSSHHPSGFSSPLGRPQEYQDRPLCFLPPHDYKRIGLVPGKKSKLSFQSGIVVEGTFVGDVRNGGRLLVLTFHDCTVSRGSDKLFLPEWGAFDMAVGELVTSVFGGPADASAYGMNNVGNATTRPGRTSPYSQSELSLFLYYQRIRELRESGARSAPATFETEVDAMLRKYPEEWLLHLEVLELAESQFQSSGNSKWAKAASEALQKGAAQAPDSVKHLIQQGLRYAKGDPQSGLSFYKTK